MLGTDFEKKEKCRTKFVYHGKKAKTARKGTEHTALKFIGEENSITCLLKYFTYSFI